MTNRREFIKGLLIVGGVAVTPGLLSGTPAAEVLTHALWSGLGNRSRVGASAGDSKAHQASGFPKTRF